MPIMFPLETYTFYRELPVSISERLLQGVFIIETILTEVRRVYFDP